MDFVIPLEPDVLGERLRTITAAFDGYAEQMQQVFSTCLVWVNRNSYCVTRPPCQEAVPVRIGAVTLD